jgi:integrase
VKDKLQALHDELSKGLHTSNTYTVRRCVEDWLSGGLDGRSAKTVSTYREVLEPLLVLIGAAKLRTLSAPQVRGGPGEALSRPVHPDSPDRRAGAPSRDQDRSSPRPCRPECRGTGQCACRTAGRPSKSLTLERARDLVARAKQSRLHAYIVLCLLTGGRTEETRAVGWDHVDLEGVPDALPPVPPHVAVWR